MRNKLVDLLGDISTMCNAGLITFAKIDEVAPESKMAEFIKNWTSQFEDRISKLRALAGDKPN